MKTNRLAVLMALLCLLMAGCGATPPTPEAAAAAAGRFLDARAAGNVAAMHGLLTERAAEEITQGMIARHIRGEQFQFGNLGAPVVVADGWVQVPVTDYHVSESGHAARWPEVRLTLHYENKRWLVGWVEPLTTLAQQAYENSQYGEGLDLARAIGEIDPYHYRGPLEVHFAYRGLLRVREAELALIKAAELATVYEQPNVKDAFARFKLSLGHPEDAISHARAALEQAEPFVPGLYSARWKADALVVLGRALLLTGDRAGAADAAARASQADPGNAGAAMLLRQLATGS